MMLCLHFNTVEVDRRKRERTNHLHSMYLYSVLNKFAKTIRLHDRFLWSIATMINDNIMVHTSLCEFIDVEHVRRDETAK